MHGSDARQRYWNIVVDCLVELFGIARPVAIDRAKNMRTRIERCRGSALFYHAEPIDVAADLAGEPSDLEHIGPAYDTILRQHDWSPALHAGSEVPDRATIM